MRINQLEYLKHTMQTVHVFRKKCATRLLAFKVQVTAGELVPRVDQSDYSTRGYIQEGMTNRDELDDFSFVPLGS